MFLGEHNVYNSLAAIAVAIKLGLDLETIKKGLCGFSGTDRRFQKKGTFNGVTVVDDYAHHPDEITATLDSCKTFSTQQNMVRIPASYLFKNKSTSAVILQKHFQLPTLSSSPTYMLQEKLITLE